MSVKCYTLRYPQSGTHGFREGGGDSFKGPEGHNFFQGNVGRYWQESAKGAYSAWS